jgi:bifunctional DNA-binding transcriptional regulator/antitoxin component of YhaV-PrlF toxin-antitoxin module
MIMENELKKLATNSVSGIGHSLMITIPKKFTDKNNIKRLDKMIIYEKGNMLIMKKEESNAKKD